MTLLRPQAVLLAACSRGAVAWMLHLGIRQDEGWALQLPDAAHERADFYDSNYELVVHHILEVGKKTKLSAAAPRTCRFCRLSPPEVTFRKEAHALPHALGNKSLTSDYECDDCNSNFGGGIENDLGAWTLPSRWLAQIKGNGGVPKIRKGSSGGWRLESTEHGQSIIQFADEPILEVDEGKRQFTLKLRRDPYHPIGVYKALVKIALTIMPEDHVSIFSEAIDWVRDPDHSNKIFHPLILVRSFVPGPRPFDNIALFLMLRRDPNALLPYSVFVIAFGNEVLQLIVPCVKMDAAISNQPFELPVFPNPYDKGKSLAGGCPNVSRVDLSGADRIKGDVVTATFSFETGSARERGGTPRSF